MVEHQLVCLMTQSLISFVKFNHTLFVKQFLAVCCIHTCTKSFISAKAKKYLLLFLIYHASDKSTQISNVLPILCKITLAIDISVTPVDKKTKAYKLKVMSMV